MVFFFFFFLFFFIFFLLVTLEVHDFNYLMISRMLSCLAVCKVLLGCLVAGLTNFEASWFFLYKFIVYVIGAVW